MVKVDEAFEVKYKKAGENFEVLVDFDKLNEYKKKPTEISVYEVLADVKIFKDQKKGDIASENLLNKVFPSKSEEQIIQEILLKGDCQIPTSYLNKLREEKKVHITNYIAENALNPKTKGKYTYTMIEKEIQKLRYNYDYSKSIETQAEEVLTLLKKVMPISITEVTIILEIPARYSGAFHGGIRKFGKITKEYYDNTGNLHLHIKTTESTSDKIIEFTKRNSNNEASYHIER